MSYAIREMPDYHEGSSLQWFLMVANYEWPFGWVVGVLVAVCGILWIAQKAKGFSFKFE